MIGIEGRSRITTYKKGGYESNQRLYPFIVKKPYSRYRLTFHHVTDQHASDGDLLLYLVGLVVRGCRVSAKLIGIRTSLGWKPDEGGLTGEEHNHFVKK